MIPNLRHLRAFCEVAKCHSVSRASRGIYLSQPAITQAIAKLEKQLGVGLFKRRSDGMFATEAGQVLAGRVARMLGLLRTGVRDAVRAGADKGEHPVASPEQKITTTQLRALSAVADAGNFSLAARNMGASQPSLHRAARDLERVLEVQLFEKTSQGIALTRPAKGLVKSVKLAFAELRQGFSELAAMQGRDTGSIVVGTMPLARTFILPAAINALTLELAKLHVNVIDGPYGDLLHGLRHGEIDVLIGALRDPLPVEDVEQEALFEDRLSIVARRGHPLTKQGQMGIRELAAYPWVIPRKGTPTRAHFEHLFNAYECPVPSSTVESSSLILIRGLLLDSDRLTLISTHQVQHEKQLGLLVPLGFGLPPAARSIGLTVRRDWRPTASQARFLDLLRDAGRQVTCT